MVLVYEDSVVLGDAAANGTPLPDYLHQACNVVASLGGRSPGAPAIQRVPQDKRLSFSGSAAATGPSSLEAIDGAERRASMLKACEEARLREKAAEVYEQGLSWRFPRTKTP